MNRTEDEGLSASEAIALVLMIIFIVGCVVAVVFAAANSSEKAQCYDLEQEGFQTKIKSDMGALSCKIIYEGKLFDDTDADVLRKIRGSQNTRGWQQ